MDINRILNYAVNCVTQKYADFSGRARRAEYWSFALCSSVISGILGMLYNWTNAGIFQILGSVFSLAILVPGLALAWRRLHDIGKSGAWYLIGLIPIVGWIILIVWFCKEGDRGPNMFGSDPKEFG